MRRQAEKEKAQKAPKLRKKVKRINGEM